MKNISVEDLNEKMSNGTKFHLLDVRNQDEYASFNIGGHLLPLDKIIHMETDDINNWKNDEIVVHCKSGNRSMQACMYLEMYGFENVCNLVGGADAWIEEFGDKKI